MRCYLKCFVGLLVVLACFCERASAWHIIGGELYYKHIGGNTYLITVKVFRDCYTVNGAPYDDPLFLGVYNGTSLVQTISIPFPGSVHLPITLDDPCLTAPPDVCVEQAIYTATVTFDNIPASGLQIVYQRCCRNATILNIWTPADVGTTYVATIRPSAVASGDNSSPYFKNYPPISICANHPLVFDHSAVDPDGDSLVYELCTPYEGATAGQPQPIPAGPPPYDFITFKPPYSESNMLGGNPAMHIDPQTGMLYAEPDAVGQFVVGVCVKEYRDGVLIGENRRDFQFNVVECQPVVEAKFKATTETSTLPADTIIVCGDLHIVFDNLSIGEINRVWNFGDPTTSADTSVEKNTAYTYPDTGTYVVRLVSNPGTFCSDTAYKVIRLHYGLVANIKTGNLQGCANSSFQFADSSQALDGELSEWNWTFGDGTTGSGPTPTHVYTSTGTYNVSLKVKTNLGCSANQTATVVINPSPQLTSGPDTMICDIDSVRLFTTPGITYAWSPNYELSQTNVQKPMAQPDVTTTYTVQVSNEYNCLSTDSVIIQVVDTVIATAWPDTTVCAGQPVRLNASGGVYYHWAPEDQIHYKSSRDAYFVTPQDNSTYYVYSYIGSCFDVDTVTVITLPIPNVQTVESRTINQGDTVQLYASGAINYVWTPPYNLNHDSIYNPLAFPLNSTTYTVTGYAQNGCYDTASVILLVTHDHYLYVPNAFSPNSDGFNDYFQFFTKGIRKILSVDIYNRWGEKVYNLEDWHGEPWNGTYKGEAQGIGVFVYVIRAETFDGDVLQEDGNLTLLR